MKLHLFRLKEADNGYGSFTGQSLDCKYPLYAFTNDKKLAERFIYERNMNKFLYITAKKPNDIAELWMHQHRGNWLSIRKIETYINKNSENQYVKWAEVLATENEVSYLESCVQSSPANILAQYVKKWYCPDIFTDKVREALEVIKYDVMYDLVMNSESAPLDYYYSEEIEVDQLGMFALIYSNILSDRFYDSIHTVDKD